MDNQLLPPKTMQSLYVHCDLAADTHEVAMMSVVPMGGHLSQVMCYEPRQMDWLAMGLLPDT